MRDEIRLGRSLFIVVALACLAGCASPTVPLMARSPQQRPDLVGRTIAILPPAAFPGEGGPSGGWERATRRIWSRPLAGVRPVPIERIREVLAADPEAFARARGRALRGLPIDDSPPQARRTLIQSKTVAGVEHQDKVWVTMRESIGGLGGSSTSLPVEWLAGFGADYVLFSLSFRSASEDTLSYALFGIVPLFLRSDVEAQRPRGNLLLYDARTGSLVWSAFVGGELRASTSRRLPDATWPALATAHLLTGALEEAVGRLLVGPE